MKGHRHLSRNHLYLRVTSPLHRSRRRIEGKLPIGVRRSYTATLHHQQENEGVAQRDIGRMEGTRHLIKTKTVRQYHYLQQEKARRGMRYECMMKRRGVLTRTPL